MANLDSALLEASGLGEAFDEGNFATGTVLEASNTITNDGEIAVFVINGSAGAITVTLVATNSNLNARGGSTYDRVLTLAAGEVGCFTPFAPGEYGMTSTITASGTDANLKALPVRQRRFSR